MKQLLVPDESLLDRRGILYKVEKRGYVIPGYQTRSSCGVCYFEPAVSGFALAEQVSVPDEDYEKLAGWLVPAKYMESQMDGIPFWYRME